MWKTVCVLNFKVSPFVPLQTAISGTESSAAAQANGESVTAGAAPAVVKSGERVILSFLFLDRSTN